MSARVAEEPGAVAGAEAPGELESLLRVPSTRTPLTPASAVCLGHIVAADAGGIVKVDYPGAGGPVVARRVLASTAGLPEPSLRVGQQVVLTFENGDPNLPIILGFIQPTRGSEAPHAEPAEGHDDKMQVIEADVDGKRVRIVAQDEIVLQCGNASVTLRRNGRVLIRGTYVETYSEGTNRIKGGQVRIN